MDLFTPIRIGKLQLDNRIIFGPHATGFEIDTDSPRAAERYGRYLARRVRGGAGLVFGANPGVDYHSGNGRVEFTIGYGPHRWRVGERSTTEEHRFRDYFCSLARIVHAAGGRIFTQLFMGAGNQTYGYPYISRPDYVVLSPSATANAASGMMAREIDPQEIETMISGAGQIAAVIQACEIDGIEFHSHAGYLMSAFLSPASNRREDEYGGSLENRVRPLLRCLQQIRLSVGPNYPLGVRYSAFENIAGGLPLEEGIEIGRILDASGLVDEISVVGAPATAGLGIPDMRYPSGFLRATTARIRSALAYRTPIACVGRIDTPELAERIIAEGSADLIAIVRSLIADPDFPVKVRTRRHDDIRRCPAANDGCVALSLETRVGSICCTVNPEAGHEQQYERSIAAAQIRRVMVIGGGPAGLKAAEQAALRGHHVVLCEKEAYLGGQVALQARVASRAQEAVVVEDLVRNIQALRVEVRLDTEVNAEYVRREAPFAVVLASGSRPVRTGYTNLTPELDGLPGADLPFVLTEEDVLRGSPVGPRVLVVEDSSGGDKRAPLIVEHLLDTGHGVDVLTTADRLGQHVSVFDSPQMLRRLYSMGMRIRSNVAVKCIREFSVIATHCHTLETEELGGFDNIVLVIGRRSSRELFRSLRGAVPELYEIGDAVSPRTVTAAVLEGFRAGRAI